MRCAAISCVDLCPVNFFFCMNQENNGKNRMVLQLCVATALVAMGCVLMAGAFLCLPRGG